jgi:hypothetical protein
MLLLHLEDAGRRKRQQAERQGLRLKDEKVCIDRLSTVMSPSDGNGAIARYWNLTVRYCPFGRRLVAPRRNEKQKTEERGVKRKEEKK